MPYSNDSSNSWSQNNNWNDGASDSLEFSSEPLPFSYKQQLDQSYNRQRNNFESRRRRPKFDPYRDCQDNDGIYAQGAVSNTALGVSSQSVDAISTLEVWLLVPGSVAEVIPSLAVLQGTSEYERFRNDVAAGAKLGRNKIDELVLQYIQRTMNGSAQPATSPQPQTQQAPSQRTPQAPSRRIQSPRQETQSPDAQNSRKKQRKKQDIPPGMVECSICHDYTPVEMQTSSMGCILAIILFFVFPFICWIPLLYYKEPRPSSMCPKCKTKLGIN